MHPTDPNQSALPLRTRDGSQPSSPGGLGRAVTRAASTAEDTATAIAEIADQLDVDGAEAVILFVAPSHDKSSVEAAIASHFSGVTVLGCTTAGEIGPAGYRSNSIVATALSSSSFTVELTRLDGVSEMPIAAGSEAARELLTRLERRGVVVDPQTAFAMLLVDGLSVREEALVASIHQAMRGIHLFGGSAGDDLRFEETFILHGGRFHTDSSVVAVVHSKLPFEVFRTQHLEATDRHLVITEADPLTRTVTEINAEPAAKEYAKQVGLEIESLTPQVFAAHPVILRIGGDHFVRSIAKVNDDDSLTFFCAVEVGTVLTVARGHNLPGRTRETLEAVAERVGTPLLTLTSDCILRRLECQRDGIESDVGELLDGFAGIGFATYGEQFDAMHVNQTLTGVMIGMGEDVGESK